MLTIFTFLKESRLFYRILNILLLSGVSLGVCKTFPKWDVPSAESLIGRKLISLVSTPERMHTGVKHWFPKCRLLCCCSLIEYCDYFLFMPQTPLAKSFVCLRFLQKIFWVRVNNYIAD